MDDLMVITVMDIMDDQMDITVMDITVMAIMVLVIMVMVITVMDIMVMDIMEDQMDDISMECQSEGMAIIGINTFTARDTPFTCTTWTLVPGGLVATKILPCVWPN